MKLCVAAFSFSLLSNSFQTCTSFTTPDTSLISRTSSSERLTINYNIEVNNLESNNKLRNRIYKSTSLNVATLRNPSTTQDVVIDDIVPSPKSYLDEGFVFGLEGSGLSRPKGKKTNVVVEGDQLETRPYQVAMVGVTFFVHATIALFALNDLSVINQGNLLLTTLQAVATIASSWVIADLGSGILHWSVDNYGNGRTPVMGNIIAAFQGHHSAPRTITERAFCNNVHKLCIPFGIPTIALIRLLAGSSHPLVAVFFTVFCSLEILSQEFHKWSHMPKAKTPSFANKIMKLGLTIDRSPHALHHTAPYEGNYCIVSGLCNKLLDSSGFFRKMEHMIYKINGIESNSWKLDPVLKEKTLGGVYKLNP